VLSRIGGLLALVLGLLLLAGCTIVVAPSEPGRPERNRTSAPPEPPDTERPRPRPDRPSSPREQEETREEDEAAAVEVVDRFWSIAAPQVTGLPYESPTVVGGYRGTSGPSCAGTPSVPGNAFYCVPGDFIAWDEDLMDAGYEQIGDSWVYLIIAHEWAHAIQARLSSEQVSVAAELQADCLAGAALQGAADLELLRIEPGDTEELARTLVAVADDFPWTDSTSHGDAEERATAFSAGAEDGVYACI
jgi:uncharacterized protein